MTMSERREQNRRDADAATERRLRVESARGEQARADAAAEHARRQTARKQRRARRSALLGRARRWCSAHAAELLIAPLAAASATLAVPAMAAYGTTVYGSATGLVLPVLSELGMWAFALAVTARRRQNPDGPVWALRAGILLFAAVGFALNLMHGLTEGVDAGLVMGVCSIAGVAAHQLVCAGPRRDRSARQTARLAHISSRKLAAAQRAAVRTAEVEFAPDGTARLVHPSGRYRYRHGCLAESTDPTGLGDQMERWLARQPESNPQSSGSSPVGTLDRLDQPADLRRVSPESNGESTAESSEQAMVQLRVQFQAALDSDMVNPTSAESIRRTLRCSRERARMLRDEHQGRQ